MDQPHLQKHEDPRLREGLGKRAVKAAPQHQLVLDTQEVKSSSTRLRVQ
jgi:hypothetical protein